MTENQALSLGGAFLHDTQTADLCREQALFDRELARLRKGEKGDPLPFRLAIPFCPLDPANAAFLAPETPRPAWRLGVLAPVAREGWIVRPLRSEQALTGSPSPESGNPLATDGTAGANAVPSGNPERAAGFVPGSAIGPLPPDGASPAALPALGPGFAGYPPFPAGPCLILGYAGGLAEKTLAAAPPFRDFSVRVWYHAEIRLEFALLSPGCRSVSWRIGKPSWIKASR